MRPALEGSAAWIVAFCAAIGVALTAFASALALSLQLAMVFLGISAHGGVLVGLALRDPRQLIAAAFGIDSLLLVPSYALLLMLLVATSRRLLQRERDQIRHTTSPELLSTYFRLHWWAAGGIVLAAGADWMENGL